MSSGRDNSNKGLRLLKKGQTGLVRAIFSRLGLMAVLILIQFALPIFFYLRWGEYISWFYTLTQLFTLAMFIVLLNCSIDPTAKITWLVIFTLLPVFGAFLFWYTRSDIGHRLLRKRVDAMQKMTRDRLSTSEELALHLEDNAAPAVPLSRYLSRSGCYPVYHNTAVTYYPSGESAFDAILRELETAKRFIFLEFFVVAEGIMWGKILEILARKAAEGVEVRLLYDGTCEFTSLSHNYPKRLRRLGIKCRVFAPITPFVSTHYNYRDHRKILVIDGHTAFNGGINLADEYINRHRRFGHWKDAAVMLKGKAVERFTLMFLEMWCLQDRKPDFDSFLPPRIPAEALRAQPAEEERTFFEEEEAAAERTGSPEGPAAGAFPAPPKPSRTFSSGCVLPYADSPLDHEKAGERVYMDLLNRARQCVHIMTPYLILDGEMETALKFCAERGVEVILILPGIPDKKFPNILAKTHYAALLEAGVRIYEYTPGFVHSKVFVADRCEAVVGTINLDYRSLYHHFECATYLYKTDCIEDIEKDFADTLPLCREITEKNRKKGGRGARLIGYLLKWLAPLV